MKRIAGIVFIAAGLLTALAGIIKTNMASDIAIIGGADGPTSIFIAGRIGYPVYGTLIAGSILLITGLVLVLMKRKNRKDKS